MALPGNAALMDLYAKFFGQAWATDWKAGLTAPFVEETAKGAVFLLLLGLAPFVIRTVYDGLIVGAYVGLGFQVLEDMLYGQNAAYTNFGVDQVGCGAAHLRHPLRHRDRLARDVHRHLRRRHHLPRRHPRPAAPGGARPVADRLARWSSTACGTRCWRSADGNGFVVAR